MKLFKYGDLIVIFLVLLLGVAACGITYGEKGKTVLIYSNSYLYGEYSLLDEKSLTVENEFGTNKVVISGENVWVEDASCKDKRDVLQGKISKSGQSIICLPNRLVVTIKGGADFDALSY